METIKLPKDLGTLEFNDIINYPRTHGETIGKGTIQALRPKIGSLGWIRVRDNATKEVDWISVHNIVLKVHTGANMPVIIKKGTEVPKEEKEA